MMRLPPDCPPVEPRPPRAGAPWWAWPIAVLIAAFVPSLIVWEVMR